MPEIRPMREADVAAVHDLNVHTFEDLSRRRGEPPEARPVPAVAHIRYRHLVRTDPGGAWVAEDERGIAGCALALRREGVWGLSLLVVRPDLQSEGVGSTLLRRAHEYADGARGRIILASTDPRALRAYARLGLALHPCVWASGVPRGVREAGAVREGTHDDIPFTEAVDRHVRGAAHGADIGTWLEMGQALLIAPERGYAVLRDGTLRVLAALDDDGARDLLRAVLARAGERSVAVEWITSAQQWAVDVCLDAGLELRTNTGPVFLDGDVGPFSPYLPSGAFL
jgi:GNAT superfamily N-acetyltransferase